MATTQKTISPVDQSVYVERDLATPERIDHTLDTAMRAQQEWKHVPIADRAALCLAMVEAFVAKAGELGAELSWQMGRPIRYTPNEIKGGFNERARSMIAAAAGALADLAVEPKQGFTRFIRHEPLGVVLTLAPWNYPYLTSVNSIIPAIMAGNTVVLKHSNQTPLCAERYAEAFKAAGAPDGLFQYLHMSHDDVTWAIGDERVNFVAFTGSVEGGHAVTKAASGRFLDLGLELGGKDPAYVREDADLAHAIENLVDGAMFNSGQSCCGIERIYVHADRYDTFVQGFVDLVRHYKLGNPLDPETTLGPMVRTSAAEFVRTQIAEAVRQGARALIDPRDFPADRSGTPYLAPQVLVDVDHSMRVM
ncbi:MAG: aldehyde dehydrogenase family protein, partial [Chloroflexota bacterium]